MATVERTTVIDASPAEVWAVLAEFADISRWAPNVDHSCSMTEQTDGVGAVRRVQTGRTTVVETVTEWDPDVAMAYTITGLPRVVRSVTNSWRLARSGAGTTVRLTSEIDAGPRPPQRGIAAIVGRKLGQASDQMLTGLRAHVASKGTPS